MRAHQKVWSPNAAGGYFPVVGSGEPKRAEKAGRESDEDPTDDDESGGAREECMRCKARRRERSSSMTQEHIRFALNHSGAAISGCEGMENACVALNVENCAQRSAGSDTKNASVSMKIARETVDGRIS